MDEHDQASTPAGGHELATEVGERVRTIISAAEEAANALRHEAEQEAAVRRRVAEDEAQRIIEDAKADADAYLAERSRRIAELSDTVVERAETIVGRLDRAEEVRRQLQALADALGESAERLASEVRVGSPPPTVRSPLPGSSVPQAAPPPPPEVSDEGVGAAPPPGAAPEARPPEAEAPFPEAPFPEAPPAPPSDAEPPLAEPPVAPPPPEVAPDAPEAAMTPSVAPPASEPPAAEPAVEAEPSPDVVRLDRREPPAPGVAAPPEAPEDEQLGARLVALQMAVAGGNRGEVEVHLRRTFELADCSTILDDIFGPGSDESKRVAWPRDGAA